MIEIAKSIVDKGVFVYGAEAQSVVAMEELAELIQAVSKMYRGQDAKDNLTEEMADVLIALENLKSIYGVNDDEINRVIKAKQVRLAERMRKGNK